MSFTLCTSGQIVAKAGRWANSTATTSGQLIQQFADEAEAMVNVAGRYDFVTNYSNIKTNTQALLQEATSSIAAMQLVSYDISGWPNIQMATTHMDFLDDRARQALAYLEDKTKQDFMKTTLD